MTIRIQFRRGTAAQWTSANPVLASGEAGFETDTGKYKLGDGATAWTSLAYIVGAQGATGATGPAGPAGADGQSAYEVAVDNGFVGNEAAWLASLVGATGSAGSNGAAGSSLTRPTASVSSSSGVVTIDLSQTTEVYTLALTENVTSWVFTNLPASGLIAEIRIDVTQHASAAKTCVSPATAGTAGGTWTVSATLSSKESLGLAIDSSGNRQLYPSGLLT